MNEIDKSNQEARGARAERGEGVLTAEQAAQRASVVVLTVGMIELAGILIPLLFPAMGGVNRGGGTTAVPGGLSGSINGWSIVLGLSGLVYLLCGVPIRFRFGPALWAGMVAALAQVIVFTVLAILGVIAGFRSGNPGTLTMAVLVFGTIASIHYFVLRWLWWAR